jgi:hypothetical protein
MSYNEYCGQTANNYLETSRQQYSQLHREWNVYEFEAVAPGHRCDLENILGSKP